MRAAIFFALFILFAAAIPPAAAAAADTNCVHIKGNLDAGTAQPNLIPPGPAYTYAQLSAADFATFFTIYDSLNGSHTLTAYFFHAGVNIWQAMFFVDSADVSGVAGTPVLVGQGALMFSSAGSLISTGGTDFTVNIVFINGSAAQAIDISLFETTQLYGTSVVSLIEDCSVNPVGSNSGLDFDEDRVDDVVFYRDRIHSVVVRLSKTNTELAIPFGGSSDYFLIGDYNGDKNPDIVAWQYRTGFVVCFGAQNHCPGYGQYRLGKRDDKPLRGDFDGDGVLDLAVWRRKNGLVYALTSSSGFSQTAVFPGSTRGDKLLTGAIK